MKSVETVVQDIYDLISAGFSGSEAWASSLSHAISLEVANKFGEEKVHYLRPSNLGDKCDRKLWLGVFRPETEEPLHAEAKIKFLYGDILEEMVLALAEAAGHKVEGQQSEIHHLGLLGHIDAIIDGTLVDVKSASSIAFDKFREHLSPAKDSFGYLYQLGFYLDALQDDPRVTNKDQAAFLVIDKTLGKMHLDIHSRAELQKDYEKHVTHKTKMLSSSRMPARGYLPEPDGKSGNLKLGTACSYCPFKHECWPTLRTFLYASGPRYLTHVARTPDVYEAKRAGKADTFKPNPEGQGPVGSDQTGLQSGEE